MNGRKGCPDLDPMWPGLDGKPRGPVLCTSYPHCICGKADRAALERAHPGFVKLCNDVLRELIHSHAGRFEPYYCSGAHSGIDLVLEFGPEPATLDIARKAADDKRQEQRRNEPWFPEGGRFHDGRLDAIDLVIARLPGIAAPAVR